jgi:hypothetical protein
VCVCVPLWRVLTPPNFFILRRPSSLDEKPVHWARSGVLVVWNLNGATVEPPVHVTGCVTPPLIESRQSVVRIT